MIRPLLTATAFATAVTMLVSGAAFAGSAQTSMGYDIFEETMPHADLETCPEEFGASDAIFCRAALVAEELVEFVFSTDDGMPLINVRSYGIDELFGS